MSFFSKAWKAVTNTVDNIIHDPLPTLVGVGLMSIGVPPMWAGAASGATSAAEHGGNILEGAAKGGILGYVGQQTSTYLSGTGASPVLVGAGTGATLGVTGSLLNGGKSMGLNAITGGIVGGVTGYYVSRTGSTTYSYEDGSTITKYPDGTITSTPADTVLAPVSDANPPPAGIADASTATKAVIANTSADAITNTGLVNSSSAEILANNGYTPTDIQNLLNKGYSSTDLANMASTGVPASTLNSLASSSFQESTINDLLTHNVSANDIATASDLVNSGKMYTNSAISLLKNGADSTLLSDIISKGPGVADQASYLLDKGVNANTVKTMVDNNINLGDVNYKLETGKVTNTQLNNSSNVNDILNTQPVKPTTTTVTNTQATAPVTPQPLGSNIPDYAIKSSFRGQEVYYDPVNGYVFNHDGSLNIDAERMADINTNNIGVKTADAQKVINDVTHPQTVTDTNTNNQPFKVEVSGAPANASYNPHNVVAPEGYRLATMDEINNGTAGDSARTLGNNEMAWLVPVNNIDVPNVTVTPPNNTQPSNLQVAHVNVNPVVPPTVTNNPVVNVPNFPIVNPTTTTTTPPTKKEEPLTPLTTVTLNPDDRKVTNVVVPETPIVQPPPPVVNPPVTEPTTTIPYNPTLPVTPPVVNVPNPPLVDTTTKPTDNTTYGHYTWGNAPQVKIPTGLNPGYIQPTPFYQTTNPAQSQYYWGSHPYQPGPTFDPTLYNNVPSAPATPFGVGHIQTQATPQQIMAYMQGLYPNLGTQTVTGPAVPIQ
jgi:hypothetical protein